MLLQTNLCGKFSIDPPLAITDTTLSAGGSLNTKSEMSVRVSYQVSNGHISLEIFSSQMQELTASSLQIHECHDGYHTDPSDPSALHLPHPAPIGSQIFLPEAECSVVSDESNTVHQIILGVTLFPFVTDISMYAV